MTRLPKFLWLLVHPFSSPPWMTQEEEERESDRTSGGYSGSSFGATGAGAYGARAGAKAGNDAIERQEAPDDPPP